ncbi:MAG: NmrA/HSCARG family protein [Gemmatimonadaceae bacterium]|nr:NmrA/HSCARG family protein [Gemmatimonadaceae bacterium]
MSKIIAVAGATGAQGGGLVRAILADKSGGFAARALTRDPGSDKAKALADLGADVVQADLHDPASVRRAFEGAYGAYCVTFFWAHMSTETELAEARSMAEAAKSARLQHVICSTLEDTRKFVPLSDNRMPTLMGRYKVPHFDVKGEADALFAASGVPVTYLVTSFYWENFIYFGMNPKKGADGKLALSLPMADKKLSGIAAEDIGKTAYAIFKKGPAATGGKRIGIAGEHLTGAEIAAKMSKALGQDITYNAVPFEVFRNLGFPGADDLGNMFQVYAEFEKPLADARDLAKTRALNPELQTFDQWLARNKEKIPLE